MIKMLLRSLLLLLILIIGLITFLLTPMGLKLSIDLAAKSLPGQLHYKKISGVIIGPITIDHLHYTSKEQTIEIEKLRVNWHPIDLLKRQLHIGTLDIQGLDIVSAKNPMPTEWDEKTVRHLIQEFITSVKDKILPLHLLIDEAKLTKIQIINPGSKTQIKSLFFHTLLTKTQWNATFIAIINKPEPYDVRFMIRGKPTDYTLHFSIQGHQTNWELTGNGNQQLLDVHTVKNLFLNGTLNSSIKINWDTAFQWNAQLSAQNINLSLLAPSLDKSFSMDVKSTGNNAKHLTTQTEVHMQSSMGQLHLTAALDNTWHIDWHLKINTASDLYASYKGNLESRGKLNGDFLNPNFDITLNGQLGSNTTSLKNMNIHLSGNVKKHTLVAQFDLNKTKMRLALDGRLNNKKEWFGTLNQLNIDLNHNGRWHLIKPTQIQTIKDTVAISSFCLASSGAGNICMKGDWANQKLEGNVQVIGNHFEWVHQLLPDVRISNAELNANFHINGPLNNPNITGTMNLKNGSILIRKLNIVLNQISASAVASGHILNVKLQVFSQNQPINLDGSIDLSNLDFIANATITANNALIINTDEYKVYATAKLTADIKNKNILFAGNIDIPKATIEESDVHATTTLPDSDIVYVGGDIPPPKPFWLIQTDLSINFGKDIFLNAAGVNAQLGGNMRLQQQPGRDLFATGKIFTYKGTYTVYGQTLTITPDSSLIFANSLLNDPTLDMKATKTISSVNNMGISGFNETNLIVGVNVTGSVKSPKILFISNRGNLSQANILSYILLGYGNTTNTPGNTDFLLRALAAVNISSQGLLGKQNIASQIQQGLGLSEMGVEQETTVDALGNPLNRQSAFVVGKHLSRKFYARYSIGLLDPVNVFELRYLFDHHWSVQTTTSILGNGMDVMYTFD